MDSYRAIEQLLYRYAESIDAGDYDAIGELFIKGEILTVNDDEVIKGKEAVTALYKKTTRLYPDDGTPKTRHITSNPIIQVDEQGDKATCRSYFTVLQATAKLPLQVIIAGRYHDLFVREKGQWFFSSRRMLPEQLGDLSQHLLINI